MRASSHLATLGWTWRNFALPNSLQCVDFSMTVSRLSNSPSTYGSHTFYSGFDKMHIRFRPSRCLFDSHSNVKTGFQTLQRLAEPDVILHYPNPLQRVGFSMPVSRLSNSPSTCALKTLSSYFDRLHLRVLPSRCLDDPHCSWETSFHCWQRFAQPDIFSH
jgi:hypothetical protein